MGAVSGQLSPVVLSCVDDADLAQKPIGSLLSGDLAYVASHDGQPEGPLYYLSTTSTAVVDGIGVLSTSAPEGRWLSVSLYNGAGTMRTVSNVAALAALNDATMLAGTLVYVATVRAYFQKVVESPAPASDGITVVPTASGDGGWYRLEVASPSWQAPLLWYVGPNNGNDENDGSSPAPGGAPAYVGALKTWAEFARRVPTIATDVTVTILGASTDPLVGDFERAPNAASTSLTVVGTPTLVASSVGSTTCVNPVPATNTKGSITVAAMVDPNGAPIPTRFDGFVGYYARTAAGAVTPILGSVAGVAEVGYWSNNLSLAVPAADTPIEVVELCSVPYAQIETSNVPLRIANFRFTDTSLNGQTTVSTEIAPNTAQTLSGPFFACRFDGYVTVRANQFVIGCLFTGSRPLYMQGGSVSVVGGAHLSKNLSLPYPGTMRVQGHTVQGGRVTVGGVGFSGGSVLENATTPEGLGIFDAPAGGSALSVIGTGQANVRSLYGASPVNGAYGLAVTEGGRVRVYAGATPTITGQLGDLQINAAATAIPPLVAGAVVPAAAPLATWAQWAAAPFARNAISYSNGSGVTS